MESKIIEKEEFLVIGLPIKVSLTDPEFQKKVKRNWPKFKSRVAEIKNRKNNLFYGTCNLSEGIPGDKCSFEYLSAVEVESADEIPEGMKVQKIPAAKYFVVSHKGTIDELGETYYAIEKELEKLNLKEDKTKIFFELYDERFKGCYQKDSELDIYSALKE